VNVCLDVWIACVEDFQLLELTETLPISDAVRIYAHSTVHIKVSAPTPTRMSSKMWADLRQGKSIQYYTMLQFQHADEMFGDNNHFGSGSSGHVKRPMSLNSLVSLAFGSQTNNDVSQATSGGNQRQSMSPLHLSHSASLQHMHNLVSDTTHADTLDPMNTESMPTARLHSGRIAKIFDMSISYCLSQGEISPSNIDVGRVGYTTAWSPVSFEFECVFVNDVDLIMSFFRLR
jgi:hypothetical protein